MNTIIVCSFILLIAVVGSLYFARQDRKERKIYRLKFTEKDRFNHRLSFLVLKQILHGLVYLGVLETVEVYLGDFL